MMHGVHERRASPRDRVVVDKRPSSSAMITETMFHDACELDAATRMHARALAVTSVGRPQGGENQPPVKEKPDLGARIDVPPGGFITHLKLKVWLLLQKSTGRGRKGSSAQIGVGGAYLEW